MTLEEVRLEHVPATHQVFLAFFRDVTNADYLQSQLLARNPDFEYAFLDASSVRAIRVEGFSVLQDRHSDILSGWL